MLRLIAYAQNGMKPDLQLIKDNKPVAKPMFDRQPHASF